MTDGLCFCVYCGAIAKPLTKAQIKMFGKQKCCDYQMLELDFTKIHTIVKNIDALKKNLEAEILQGMI